MEEDAGGRRQRQRRFIAGLESGYPAMAVGSLPRRFRRVAPGQAAAGGARKRAERGRRVKDLLTRAGTERNARPCRKTSRTLASFLC